MMRKIGKLFTETKPLLVALVCIFIISSCRKPQTVCTLTTEQAPEIRGIKLGMSYDEISERFRAKCNLKIISPQQFLHTKIRYSIRIGDADWQNKTASKESEKYNLKGLDTGCFSYLGDTII